MADTNSDSQMLNTIFDPTIWHEPDDTSSTIYDIVQILPEASSASNVSSGSGLFKFVLRKSSTYILFAHPDTCLRFKLRYATLQNNAPFRFADIAPESDLGSMLVSKATFKLCGTSLTDVQNSFNIYHEIENHMEGIEFRQKSGEEQGFIPDENSGLAESIQCAYLTLVPTANVAANNAAAVPPTGLFGVYITNNTGADLANAATFLYYIPGTNLAITLITLAAMPNGSVGVCAVAAPAAIAANGTITFSLGYINLVLAGLAAAAVVANAAAYIQLQNTTGAQILGLVTVNQLATVNGINQLSSYQLPLNVGYNPLYEPGYVRRKKYYNYIPNSSINTQNVLTANNFSDSVWRYIDIKMPLRRISRFCRDYQAVIGNCDIELVITMSSYVGQLTNTSTALFNTSPTAQTNNIQGMNAVFGMPNAQMIIQPTSVTMDYVTYMPSPEAQISLNSKFSNRFSVDYTDVECTLFPGQWNISGKNLITQMELPTKRRICYLILVFKNNNLNASTQNYGGFPNGNVNSMQVKYGATTLIPTQPQNDDFTQVSNTSMCSGPKHFYAQYRNLFERWHATQEVPMSESDFRNLYTMYCFDFTDVNQGNKNLETSIYVTINRVRNNNETATSYECYYALYYKRTANFDFTGVTPTCSIDQ